jgi:hypothetical protein
MILGVVLQAFALHGAAIALVEPILVAELPLTLLIAALVFRARVDRRTGWTILLMSIALSILLVLARPEGGHVARVPALNWILTLAAVAGLTVILVIASLKAPPAGRAALLGIASGVGHGLSATLLKATTVLAAQGLVVMLSSWKPYAGVLAGGVSLYLYQVALQSGPLVAGQAGLNILDPLTATCLGVVLFHEHVRTGALLAVEAVCLVVLVASVIILARSPLLHDERAEPPAATEVTNEDDGGRRVVS